jgi:hypothetical protein
VRAALAAAFAVALAACGVKAPPRPPLAPDRGGGSAAEGGARPAPPRPAAERPAAAAPPAAAAAEPEDCGCAPPDPFFPPPREAP